MTILMRQNFYMASTIEDVIERQKKVNIQMLPAALMKHST